MFAFCQFVEMLLSRKRRHGDAVVYAGVDPQNREDAFLTKCIESLRFLQEQDTGRYGLFVEHIGRILGSPSYTNFYSFPRLLEINHSEILQESTVSVASLIVGFTELARYRNQFRASHNDLNEMYRLCLNEEAQFRKEVTGEDLSELEILQIKQKRFLSPDARKDYLRGTLRGLFAKTKKETSNH